MILTMRIFFRKPEINPSVSELVYSALESVHEINKYINTPPELAKDDTCSINLKKTSGLHKSQRIDKTDVKTTSNIDKKISMLLQSSIAENDQQIAENEIFERKMRHLAILLIKRLKRKEADLDILSKKYQASAKKIKSLQEINLAHQKAIKIYRDELRATNIDKRVNLKSSISKRQ